MVSVKVLVVPSDLVETPMVVGLAPSVVLKFELVLIHESREPSLRAVDDVPAGRPWFAERIVSWSRFSSCEALESC